MSREIQKLSYKYQYLKLELEELEELIETRTRIFNSTFGKYFMDKNSEFWINEETGEIRKDMPSEEIEPKKQKTSKKLKDLYKKISRYTHPDKGGSAKEFQDVKAAYDNNDYLDLISYASKYGVNVTATEEDKTLIINSIDTINNTIASHENSLAYNFFSKNKKKKLAVIKEIERIYGLNFTEKELQDFLDVTE